MASTGASIVIFDAARERVLLVKREDIRIWALPGGHIEPGETAEQAAIREAYEETGYAVTCERYVGEYWRPQLQRHMFVYCGSTSEPPMKAPDRESVAVAWWPLSALPWNVIAAHREILQDALTQTTPVQKTQRIFPGLVLYYRAVYLIRKLRTTMLQKIGRGPH